MQQIADYLDPAVYPQEAIKAVHKIEEEAIKKKNRDLGFRISFNYDFSNEGKLKVERIRRDLAWKGEVK